MRAAADSNKQPTGTLVAHKVHSQIAIHREYGGVVPELAARNHIEKLPILTKLCLEEAGIQKQDINAVAYTKGPGLIPCLAAGASYARAFAYGLQVPALGVNHLEGHLLSPMLAEKKPSFPYAALLVSGGHTQLYLARDWGDYTLGGDTLDDAAGEAFDKVASMLGLPYPGGAELEELAKQGDPRNYRLTMPLKNAHKDGNYNFSFSGIKTQVKYLLNELEEKNEDNYRADLAAALQDTISQGLVDKVCSFARRHKLRNIAIVGGVSANKHFRKLLSEQTSELKQKAFLAPLEFCTDNAAMIALAGSYQLLRGKQDNLGIRATPRLPVTDAATGSAESG